MWEVTVVMFRFFAVKDGLQAGRLPADPFVNMALEHDIARTVVLGQKVAPVTKIALSFYVRQEQSLKSIHS